MALLYPVKLGLGMLKASGDAEFPNPTANIEDSGIGF